MLGGKEEPCVPAQTIVQIQAKNDGRYCPRVELREDNYRAVELCFFAARSSADNALWLRLFDFHIADLDAESARAELAFILNVIGNEAVSARIKAAREREQERGRA